MGRFKAPNLRNIAVTAPYMHDGSIATLRDAIAHYQAGGRITNFKTRDRDSIDRAIEIISDAVYLSNHLKI